MKKLVWLFVALFCPNSASASVQTLLSVSSNVINVGESVDVVFSAFWQLDLYRAPGVPDRFLVESSAIYEPASESVGSSPDGQALYSNFGESFVAGTLTYSSPGTYTLRSFYEARVVVTYMDPVTDDLFFTFDPPLEFSGSGKTATITVLDPAAAVPEASTWTMLMVSFVCLGMVGYWRVPRRSRLV